MRRYEKIGIRVDKENRKYYSNSKIGRASCRERV